MRDILEERKKSIRLFKCIGNEIKEGIIYVAGVFITERKRKVFSYSA